MIILGIESSCDECSVAILRDGELVAHEIASQIPLHQKYGGVVPEIASRAHILDLIEVFERAFADAKLAPSDITHVAVTQGPGLIGSLLVGLEAGKTFAYAHNIPLIGVHHTEGHLLAPLLERAANCDPPAMPFLGLVVSGGHTNLIRVNDISQYEAIGETLDDAAGEALDKIGKALGLPYPAGIAIDRLSEGGDRERFKLPRPLNRRDNYDFSFSGLKTAALTQLRKLGELPTDQLLSDFCASVLEAVVDSLVTKSIRAAVHQDLSTIVVTGGVSANRRLRQVFQERCQRRGIKLSIAAPHLCTDNAAMIAQLGALKFARYPQTHFTAYDLEPKPNWRIV